MEVYVEDVIADNFIMTYMVSSISYVATKRVQNRKRKIIGAIISTLIALIYPFINNTIVLYALKICVWLFLSVVLYAKKQKFIVSAFTLLFVTFSVAGGIIAISSLLKVGNVYQVQRVTLAGFIISSILRFSLIRIARFGTYSQFICSITLQIYGIKRTVVAYRDTGNLLIDESSGLAVVIITSKTLASFIRDKTAHVINPDRYINYSSVDGIVKKLFLIDGCKVVCNNIENDVVVGLTTSNLINNADVIIGPNL